MICAGLIERRATVLDRVNGSLLGFNAVPGKGRGEKEGVRLKWRLDKSVCLKNEWKSRRLKARSADPLIATVDERSEEAVVPADSGSKQRSGDTLADEKRMINDSWQFWRSRFNGFRAQ